MANIGKYILRTGEITDICTKLEKTLGVIFDEDKTEYRFLPFTDAECFRAYSLKDIVDIAQSYNLAHGNRYLQWSVPSLRDWNMILHGLAKIDIVGREELSGCDRMSEWTEFDSVLAIDRLKKYKLQPDIYYWSSSEGDDGEVYFLNLNGGTVESYPVWDDGEEYDYALRLVGHVVKNRNNFV